MVALRVFYSTILTPALAIEQPITKFTLAILVGLSCDDVLATLRGWAAGYRFATTNKSHPKILLAPGGGTPDDIDQVRARAGFNPSPIPPPPPEKKIFGLKQREKKTEAIKEKEAKIKRIWNYYLKHRNDMAGVLFAMGPDFKEVGGQRTEEIKNPTAVAVSPSFSLCRSTSPKSPWRSWTSTRSCASCSAWTRPRPGTADGGAGCGEC